MQYNANTTASKESQLRAAREAMKEFFARLNAAMEAHHRENGKK